MSHIVFQYQDYRLEGKSYLDIEANETEQITKKIEQNNDKIKRVTEQRHKEEE